MTDAPIYLLDTDTLTHLYRDHPRVVRRLREAADIAVGTTIITKIEILQGRFEAVLKAATSAELLKAQELLIRSEEQLARMLVVACDV